MGALTFRFSAFGVIDSGIMIFVGRHGGIWFFSAFDIRDAIELGVMCLEMVAVGSEVRKGK